MLLEQPVPWNSSKTSGLEVQLVPIIVVSDYQLFMDII